MRWSQGGERRRGTYCSPNHALPRWVCVPGDPSCIEVGVKVDRMNPGSLTKCSPEPRNFLKLKDQLSGLSIKMFWGICFGWHRLETGVNSRKVSARQICLNAFQDCGRKWQRNEVERWGN